MAERQAYVYIQLPGTLESVPAALLKVTKQGDGTHVGRFRYGDRYLQRHDAIELDPFQLLPPCFMSEEPPDKILGTVDSRH